MAQNVFALQWPRPVLHCRIEQRVQAMFQDGLVDEVRSIRDLPAGFSRTAAQAVGYREILDHLDGQIDLETAKEQVTAHTRRLARRQETWLRSFSEIKIVPVDEPLDPDEVLCQIIHDVKR